MKLRGNKWKATQRQKKKKTGAKKALIFVC